MTQSSKPPIVLIHGLWMTALSWEHWVERYRARGYEVIAKSWPGMNDDIAAMRANPESIEHVGVGEVVEHYQQIITGLASPPIIIGHSFGALVTQVLLDHGLGCAGVSIDSAPIKGVYKLPWSALRSAFPALKNPANNHRAVMLTAEQFHYAFTNNMTDEESQRAYERYAVPGPGRALFQAALANFNPHAATKVDVHNENRAPLLVIAGDDDHVSPPAINRSIAKLQHRSKALTAYKQFPGRSHFIIGQSGWEEIADYALAWALSPTADEP